MVRKWQFARDRHQQNGIFLEELEPFARQRRPPRQCLGECGAIERKNLCLVAAQTSERAGIAFAFGGFQLGFIAIAQP